MASEKQIAANRLNSQKSTGPRTPEGKVAVSQNAFVHGLRSRRLLLPKEDAAEYQGLAADLEAEWQPATPTEAAVVEQMAVALWKGQRLDGLEQRKYLNFVLDEPKLMDAIWRQQARMERSFHKAIEQLQRLRKAPPAVQSRPVQTREPALTTSLEIVPAPAPPEFLMHAPHSAPPLNHPATQPPVHPTTQN